MLSDILHDIALNEAHNLENIHTKPTHSVSLEAGGWRHACIEALFLPALDPSLKHTKDSYNKLDIFVGKLHDFPKPIFILRSRLEINLIQGTRI